MERLRMGNSPKPGGDLPAKPGYTIPKNMDVKLAAKVRAGQACGANKKKGGYCANAPHEKVRPHYPMRCRFHGGKSPGAPKGNQNARKRGIYTSVLTEAQKEMWDDVPIGDVGDEIKVAKLQLLEAMAGKAEQEQWLNVEDATKAKNKIPIAEISMRSGTDGKKKTSSVDVTRRKTDFDRAIHNIMNRIVRLENQQHILTGGDTMSGEDKVNKIREMMVNINQQTGFTRPVVREEDLPE